MRSLYLTMWSVYFTMRWLHGNAQTMRSLWLEWRSLCLVVRSWYEFLGVALSLSPPPLSPPLLAGALGMRS